MLESPARDDVAPSPDNKRGYIMLKWAILFAIISVIAGVFGFTGIASGAASIAKTLFFIAVALFVIFLVLALMAGSAIL